MMDGRVIKYQIDMNSETLRFCDVVRLWQTNHDFRVYFCTLLAESEFVAYKWETPAITKKTINRQFEFVLLNAPEFANRPPDNRDFSEYFALDNDQDGIVTFDNISRDAKLIVPVHQGADSAYSHLASFIRYAPEQQVEGLWQIIGKTVTFLLNTNPIWLSTAGGGVAWLHIRIDNYPKYYGYNPYRNID